jgi:hypothetical protein
MELSLSRLLAFSLAKSTYQYPNKVVVEYSLKNVIAILGVAEYQLTHAVSEELRGDLPSIEELEEELDRRLHSNGNH